MSLSTGLRLFVLSGLTSALVLACVVENDHYRSASGGSGGSAGTGGDTGGSNGTNNNGTCSTTPSAKPLLADVDTGQTMKAQPGDGVGFFSEYSAGGHWHIWWTCDTNQTGASCPMKVDVSVASGAISNVTPDSAADTAAISSTTQKIEASTTTTTGVDGMRFDTTPGAIITLGASVNGCYDGSFLFFVQSGKVNGGFQGVLTNPIQLEGSAP
jgi:hypothetical protein